MAKPIFRCAQDCQILPLVSVIHWKATNESLASKSNSSQAPFQQWGLDFIGKFKDNSRNGYSWILIATDYFTKWVEAIPTKKVTDAIVMDFLDDKIITRFGVPARIITDNGPCFVSSEMSSFCFKYGIVLSHSSNYYPQGNGLAESSNKKLMTIIKQIVGDNKKAWDSKIKLALWANRITKKSSKGLFSVEIFLVIRSAHNAYVILLSCAFLLSPTVFFYGH